MSSLIPYLILSQIVIQFRLWQLLNKQIRKASEIANKAQSGIFNCILPSLPQCSHTWLLLIKNLLRLLLQSTIFPIYSTMKNSKVIQI